MIEDAVNRWTDVYGIGDDPETMIPTKSILESVNKAVDSGLIDRVKNSQIASEMIALGWETKKMGNKTVWIKSKSSHG